MNDVQWGKKLNYIISKAWSQVKNTLVINDIIDHLITKGVVTLDYWMGLRSRQVCESQRTEEFLFKVAKFNEYQFDDFLEALMITNHFGIAIQLMEYRNHAPLPEIPRSLRKSVDNSQSNKNKPRSDKQPRNSDDKKASAEGDISRTTKKCYQHITEEKNKITDRRSAVHSNKQSHRPANKFDPGDIPQTSNKNDQQITEVQNKTTDKESTIQGNKQNHNADPGDISRTPNKADQQITEVQNKITDKESTKQVNKQNHSPDPGDIPRKTKKIDQQKTEEKNKVTDKRPTIHGNKQRHRPANKSYPVGPSRYEADDSFPPTNTTKQSTDMFSNDREDLCQQVKHQEQEINNLKSIISSLEFKRQTAISQYDNDVGRLKKKLKDTNSDLKGLESRNLELEKRLSDIIKDRDLDISALKGDLEDAENHKHEESVNLKTKITTLKTEIEKLKNEISSLEDGNAKLKRDYKTLLRSCVIPNWTTQRAGRP